MSLQFDSPSLHMTVQTAVLIETLVVLGDLVILISLDPGKSWKACFTAKLTAVLGAAVARGISYRFVLFREFRNQQMKPNVENLIDKKPRISLIIPAFEEADRIRRDADRQRAEEELLRAKQQAELDLQKQEEQRKRDEQQQQQQDGS